MTKTVQELVHEQVAAKIAAGEALEADVSAVSDAAAVLAEAEAQAAKSRRAALKAGWSEAELRSLGLAGKTRAKRRSGTPLPTSAERVETSNSEYEGE